MSVVLVCVWINAWEIPTPRGVWITDRLPVPRYAFRVSSFGCEFQPVRVYPPSTDRTLACGRTHAARCAPRCKMLISALASQTLIYPRAELRVAPRPLSLGLSTSARRARFASPSMSGTKGAPTKFIVVTGGVISGIGKGVTASSIGVCMKMLGARVTAVKIDPYLNVDAGTMSPLEHGECFVLDDGGETDLDLGNYERFLDVILGSDSNLTTGKIYKRVIERERAGEYLGKTVQIIPHSTARGARTRGAGGPGRGRLLTRVRSALHSHQRDHGSHPQRGAQPNRRERRAAAHLHRRAGGHDRRHREHALRRG